MSAVRAASIAAALVWGLTLPAQAQMLGPGMPMPGASPQTGMMPAPGAAPQRQAMPPCMQDFIPLRDEAQKRADAISKAAKRKAPRPELCQAFRRFAEAEAKVAKFMEVNAQSCGIPAEAATATKSNHAKTLKVRDQICASGPMGDAQAPKPTGPGLSEALGTLRPPLESSSGRGTFDTLSGNVLK